MKVSELEGALLDYWVATALDEGNGGNVDSFMHAHRIGFLHYSTEWGLAGPVIEREKIAVFIAEGGKWGAERRFGDCDWIDTDIFECDASGSTPLIAAMRAYVIKKIGATVPDEV